MQKVYRLKKAFQFNYIYRKGQSLAGREMALVYARNRRGALQVGVSVSKKIGKSVVRNRVKRQFKEAFRLLIPKVDKNYNYILIARSDAVTASYKEIEGTLKYLLNKAGKLKKEDEKAGSEVN